MPAARPAGAAPLSTGVAVLDAALGGGLARGHLTEIVSAASAGGTALLRAALGAATRRGELCALIDPDDAFDPGGALDAGLPDPARIDLRRLLWIRPPSLSLALRAAEVALEARFALVVLDLAGLAADRDRGGQISRVERQLLSIASRSSSRQLSLGEGADRERVVRTDRDDPDRQQRERTGRGLQRAGPPWARLARRAEQHGGALLVLGRSSQVGAFAVAAVELVKRSPRWTGTPGTPGRLLAGANTSCTVARLKGGMPSAPLALSLPWG